MTHPEPDPSTIEAWEAAYRRFETPAEERAKFTRRLKALGVDRWDSDLLVTELFCGRGNGLLAWQDLGFSRLEGLDISADLLSTYEGPARSYVGDARELPFPSASRDVISVQGGLHHLRLMHDLETSLSEIHRVLKPAGRLVLVEPWLTPFLQTVHLACSSRMLCRVWPRLDAMACMVELERDTYEDWLSKPEVILEAIRRIVNPSVERIGWGKLMLVGTRR